MNHTLFRFLDLVLGRVDFLALIICVARTNYTCVLVGLCRPALVGRVEDMSHENWIATFAFNNSACHSPVLIEADGVPCTLFLWCDLVVVFRPSKLGYCVLDNIRQRRSPSPVSCLSKDRQTRLKAQLGGARAPCAVCHALCAMHIECSSRETSHAAITFSSGLLLTPSCSAASELTGCALRT